MQRLEEETFGRLSIARRAQEKLQRVSLGIDRPVEVHPAFADFDVGLVHLPGVVGGSQMRSASLLQFLGIALAPAVDRRMIHVQSPLPHHLFEVAIAERIPQVPAHAQQDDLGFKMTPFERTWIAHNSELLCSSRNKAEFTRASAFLQQNRFSVSGGAEEKFQRVTM